MFSPVPFLKIGSMFVFPCNSHWQSCSNSSHKKLVTLLTPNSCCLEKRFDSYPDIQLETELQGALIIPQGSTNLQKKKKKGQDKLTQIPSKIQNKLQTASVCREPLKIQDKEASPYLAARQDRMHRSFLADACPSCSARPSKEEPTPPAGNAFQGFTSITARKGFFSVATLTLPCCCLTPFLIHCASLKVFRNRPVVLIRFEMLHRLDSCQRDKKL